MIHVEFIINNANFPAVRNILNSPGIQNVKINKFSYTGDQLIMFRVLELICNDLNVSVLEALTMSRKNEPTEARYIFCYLINQMFPKWSDQRIGDFLGRDRTILIHARKTITGKITGMASEVGKNKELKIKIINCRFLIRTNMTLQNLIAEYTAA